MKRIRVLMLALAVSPAALAAQQPTPAQPTANGVTQSFKVVGARYGGLLAQAFDSIPASKYGFKPTPVQQTLGYIAQHLENANYQLCAAMSGQKYAMTAKDSLADTVKAMWPKDTLVARLKASLAYCDDAFGKVTDAQLTDMLPAGPPGSNRTIMRSRYLIGYVTDLAEHYAQTAAYMRIIGMVPPSALPRPAR